MRGRTLAVFSSKGSAGVRECCKNFFGCMHYITNVERLGVQNFREFLFECYFEGAISV